jgi:mannosyltransferase
VLLPFVVAAWSQHGQVSWIPVPHVYDLTGFYVQVFGSRLPVVLAVTAVGAVVVGTLWAPRTPRTPTGADGRQLRSGPAGTAFVVGAVWAGGPPVLLWTLSQVVPLWDLHYVLFCLPGVALLIASLPPLAASARAGFTVPRAGFTVARAGFTVTQAVVSVLAVGVVLLVGVLGLPQQAAYRDPGSGHAEDLRGVAAYLRANALPGDAVVYSSAELRMLGALYPSAVAALDDVALARDPLASASLYGVEITPEALPAALANHPRVWLVRSSAGLPDAAPAVERAKLTDLEAGFRQASAAAITTIEVVLYLPR